MENNILLLMCLCYSSLHITSFVSAHMITQPPESVTTALGTNATFSCRGTGSVLWQINGSQVQDASQLSLLASFEVFVPLPRQGFSELIVTATRVTNATQLEIICIVDPGIGMGQVVASDPVQLLVYAEPNSPVDMNITVEELSLVATWNEPFTLEGEELLYIVTITNTASGVQEEVTVNTTRYAFSKSFGERDCAEYQFTVFSENDYSKSMINVSEWKNIPTVPLVMRSSDVWINVSLTEGIEVMITYRPRDPCPAYPVEGYIFNISEENGNFIASVNHTENTSVNINGTDYGLLHNQVYHLTVEATNDVGSSYSEEIHLYTTGLQSSVALVELNGSITVTCIFAAGASSTGCQVTIFKLESLQEVFSENITRLNGNRKISATLDTMIANYDALLVQTVELLNGEEISNVTFNQTINSMATSTTPSAVVSTIPATPTPIPYEYIIVVAVLLAVLVFILMTAIIVCVIFALGARRKSSRKGLSSQGGAVINRDALTTPAYESIEIDHATTITVPTLHNPVYNDKIIKEHYEMQDLDQIHEETARESDQLNEIRGESNPNIHTDPITGYSTLLRPDKSQPSSSQVAFYESIKLKGGFLKGGDKSTAQLNCQYSTLKQDSQPTCDISHTSSHYKEKSSLESVQSSSESVPIGILLTSPTTPTAAHAACTIPTDPETGYSSMLRPDKVVPPPPGPVPHYDVINVKDKQPLMYTARSNNDRSK